MVEEICASARVGPHVGMARDALRRSGVEIDEDRGTADPTPGRAPDVVSRRKGRLAAIGVGLAGRAFGIRIALPGGTLSLPSRFGRLPDAPALPHPCPKSGGCNGDR